MTIHIGFSGTRYGMTHEQGNKVALLLDEQIELASRAGHSVHAHHGDCEGADDSFHALCRDRQLWIVGHPPIVGRLRAFNKFDEERQPKPYLERNSDIVEDCSIIIAAPKHVRTADRSGTWSTIRMACRHGREVIVVDSNGRSKRWP